MDKETAHLAKQTFQLPVRFFEIEKSQQGKARNKGVSEAKGEMTLFLGDDMWLEPDACATHLTAHTAPIPSPSPDGGREGGSQNFPSPLGGGTKGGGNRAVLGHVTWDPSLAITPVMRWLEETGWQFGYPLLKAYEHAFVPRALQHRFTYTANISLPTETARRVPFREGIDLYGWEDIEWGLRLKEAGLPLFYEPDAKVFHHHALTLEESLRRMETLGKSAAIFERIDPRMTIVPRGWKRLAYKLIATLPTMRGRHAKAFLRGLFSEK